ncbi:AzlD domain-containing protein [Streptomyces sp. KR80]|uniref:AzlD domain-containing protein n=1 Tax=Streptomyces sp. KR80 TaxID=3457426 RepID=UPI003FD4881D
MADIPGPPGVGLVLLLLAMGGCAFATRWLPLVLLRGRELPGALRSAVGYVPVAVLAAMVVPAVIAPEGDGVPDLEVASLAGGAVTLGAGLLTKRMLLATALGVAVFFVVVRLRGV